MRSITDPACPSSRSDPAPTLPLSALQFPAEEYAAELQKLSATSRADIVAELRAVKTQEGGSGGGSSRGAFASASDDDTQAASVSGQKDC